ncbi:arylamine N-acetyltransferase family protein [Pseudonocardia alaniniphila]|uniref:Arylamine N-acetyltransferase n=1 Tax=Pseudonocardia alaniniphila TaxID=75291 RepID=A0ABS9T965_9PSEU|nr:arylamine N-acetyltransferase [Pseudonocardia alaniniphila]MCH6164968.1 arylamine N-acetyltransferase [Pseudonocardia alaniniphila]
MIDGLLHRIGYDRPIHADPETLRRLHRAWRTQVPYENLDIQLGRPINLEPGALLDKLVRRRRGGYCYELNGGLALLLESAGFEVTMVEGGVLRETRGDAMWGNHNVLLVDLDGERWVADAGIGDGFLEPLRLREGSHTQGAFTYRLERLDPDTWRFHHHPGGTVASYDFRLRPRELAEFSGRSHELSTSPDSAYVTTLIAARPVADATLLLLSRTVRRLGANSRQSWTVSSVEEFADVLSERLLIPLDDLGPDGVARLWEKAGVQDDLWQARVENNPRK